MTRKRIWGIWSHPIGSPKSGGWIESSKGYPYKELKAVASRMFDGREPWKYVVREVFE